VFEQLASAPAYDLTFITSQTTALYLLSLLINRRRSDAELAWNRDGI